MNNENDIRAIYRTPSCTGSNFNVKVLREDTHMDFVQAVYTVSDPNQILPELMRFRSNCPGTLSAQLLTMIKSYLESHFLTETKPPVYGLIYSLKKKVYEVVIKCSLISPFVCDVNVSKNIS